MAAVRAAALILALLAMLQQSLAFDWKVCGSGGQSKVNKVDLTPDPPKPGDSVTFTVDAEAAAQLDAGTTETDVFFMGFPIWAETGDLCSATACPIHKGPMQLALHRDFPPITPPGNYTVQIHVKPSDGASEFMCVEVDFQVVLPSF